MRQVLSGSGVDTTATVAAYLAAGNKFKLADIYLIGDYDDPQAVRLTNWEAPLDYPIWGKFLPAVVTRGDIESKIGLEVSDLEINWTPVLSIPTQSIATANPYQLAQIGFFDNKLVRCWTVFMPTPGDANTYGACAMFGGRIGQTEVKRGNIKFTVNSFLDVVNEMVPTQVIELNNATAGYAGATPPPGVASVPQFDVIAGSTPSVIIGDETGPNAHHIYGENAMRGWFLVFNGGGSSTLSRQLARIVSNIKVTFGSFHYNQITLYEPLPWAPTPGDDTFYVSASSPVNAGAVQTATLNAAGSGYTAGDLLTVTGGGGSDMTIQVITIGGGGAVATYSIVDPGTGYQATTGAATSGGSGAGATFDLVVYPTTGFPYVPAPNTAL